MNRAPKKRRPLIDRFNKKIVVTPGCWIWIGAKNSKGYGQTTDGNSKKILAHRASFELHIGDIPDGHMVLHRCDNRACVNPDHLFSGTAQDNTDDMMKKGRHRAQKGAESHKAKLTDDDVRAIRKEKCSIRKIAEKYGVTHGAIEPILSGKGWKHII